MSYVFVFFFFQAEDGIRDVAVTGVQTCALPILYRPSRLVRPCRLVPTTSTEAPVTACWFDLSVTCPVTLPRWACTGSATTTASSTIAVAGPSNWGMRKRVLEPVLIPRGFEPEPGRAGPHTQRPAHRRGAPR